MLFLDLFFGLRSAGVKVGLGEWMSLLRAMKEGALGPSLRDLYAVGRALLVKHEAQFDTWDQVFAAVFHEGEFPRQELEELMEWLADPQLKNLSPEELAKLDRLPLDELRRRFEERLREQRERHDGGSHYIGTGGTSPFGNSGANPAGMRVGGSGGGKSAVQIAEERRYADLRKDRILDTRSLAVALKKLRRLARKEGEPELDVEDTIDRTCQNAGELELVFRPPRKNEARVLLLMDVGGSMDPHARLVEQLFSAASNLNSWRKFEAFFFHNCPYETVFTKMSTGEGFPTADLMRERPKETFLIVVGDADMAPSELTARWGSLPYYTKNYAPGLVWLHRMRSHFTRCVWLNPLQPKYWPGSFTIRTIGRLFPMYPLTLEGLEESVEHLLRRIPEPVPELPTEFR